MLERTAYTTLMMAMIKVQPGFNKTMCFHQIQAVLFCNLTNPRSSLLPEFDE